MVSTMRRRDKMESQTIGYQPMMARHRGKTETPMPISGMVVELISVFLMMRVSLNPGQLNVSPRVKNCLRPNPLWVFWEALSLQRCLRPQGHH